MNSLDDRNYEGSEQGCSIVRSPWVYATRVRAARGQPPAPRRGSERAGPVYQRTGVRDSGETPEKNEGATGNP